MNDESASLRLILDNIKFFKDLKSTIDGNFRVFYIIRDGIHKTSMMVVLTFFVYK